MKKLLVLTIFSIFIASVSLSAPISGKTTLPIQANDGGLYGFNDKHVAKELIGTNISGNISIDRDGAGVKFGGVIGSYVTAVSPNSSATTSMTTQTVIFYNGATIGTQNVVLPSSPISGQIASIASKPTVSVLTVTAGSKTVNGGATSISPNAVISYIYESATNAWYKFY
jgi:hypothetical protein